MATSAQTFSLSFTQTNALQPSRVTPPDLLPSTDTVPTMVSEGYVVVPAAGMTLSLPAGWTRVTQVLIVNTDLTSYLNLAFSTVARVLPPNGGAYSENTAYNTATAPATPVPVAAGQTAATAYGTWVLRPVGVTGAYGAVSAAAYIWLAGF